MTADTVVGLLTLLSIIYVAWLQTGQRESLIAAQDAAATGSSAEALAQVVESLLKAVETLANREALIAELRGRIEVLERHDRLKSSKIGELEFKLSQMEQERGQLISERDSLVARLLEQPSADKFATANKR